MRERIRPMCFKHSFSVLPIPADRSHIKPNIVRSKYDAHPTVSDRGIDFTHFRRPIAPSLTNMANYSNNNPMI
jgi:hypothetical protein